MILSARQVRQLLDKQTISITPFLDANLKSASYTFRLAEDILCLPEGGEPIDLSSGKPMFIQKTIPSSGFILNPGQFVVGSTIELVKLAPRISCMLSGRGSCAQAGLNVLQSSTFAEPDTNNRFALEMSNSGNRPILLRTGLNIVKGVFIAVSERLEQVAGLDAVRVRTSTRTTRHYAMQD